MEYLIGTGGWAYFRTPSLRSLQAYSKAFNFVEVNTTFYKTPSIRRAESWRRIVPKDFQFSVRANQTVSHINRLQPTKETLESIEKTHAICNVLNAEVMHVQMPPSFEVGRRAIEDIRNTVSSLNLGKTRIALETRASMRSHLPEKLVNMMQEHNIIHCVDLSKGETPVYDSDILYSRLFGKGYHNIYQPTDKELRTIHKKATSRNAQKAMISFHFVRMYKDAARLKIFSQTGKFPMITQSTGLKSLRKVLNEDAEFPSSKQHLLQSQGWKLFDLTPEKRIRAQDMLLRIPDKVYENVNEVMQAL